MAKILFIIISATVLYVEVVGLFLGNYKACYDNIGCFDTQKPFTNTFGFLPQSPSNVIQNISLFTRKNANNGELLDFNNPATINTTNWSVGSPIKMVIHGYMSSGNEPWVGQIKDGVLNKGDFNVIVVDWRKGAHDMYQKSVANTRVLGAVIARLLTGLQTRYNVRMQDVHIIGHSLGAQTAGNVGRRVQNLGRISGLDPAGPLFEKYGNAVKLDHTDAIFVDVVHSDALPFQDAGFGTRIQTGDIDFYPNGGGHQPGCPAPVKTGVEEMLSMDFENAFMSVACSHDRSYHYYVESILNTKCKFVAYPCNSYDDFKAGQCTTCGNSSCPIMGYDAIQSSARGNYYLQTNSKSPFCKVVLVDILIVVLTIFA